MRIVGMHACIVVGGESGGAAARALVPCELSRRRLQIFLARPQTALSTKRAPSKSTSASTPTPAPRVAPVATAPRRAQQAWVETAASGSARAPAAPRGSLWEQMFF